MNISTITQEMYKLIIDIEFAARVNRNNHRDKFEIKKVKYE